MSRKLNADDLAKLQLLARDMGLKLDQMGLPVQMAQHWDDIGKEYYPAEYDWNPLDHDSDAFRLLVHYQLTLEEVEGLGYYAGQLRGESLAFCGYPADPLERPRAARRALVDAAAAALALRAKYARNQESIADSNKPG